MSLDNPLIQSANSANSDEFDESYEEKPARIIDWVIIVGLMLSTYSLIILVLYWMINWGTSSSNQTSNNKQYHENMYFNLLTFIVYIVTFGAFWFFGIGKRDAYRRQLMDAQIALKENLR